MQLVVEGLTKPLDDEDLAGLSFDRSAPALLDADTEENLQRLFVEERWTDFLPIVLPTEERVEAMLAGTSRARDEVVGRMRPTAFREFWEFTVEKVAVNAVMAGARPEYLPVILAAMASGMTGALELDDVVRHHRDGQRPDPQRDRHELGHRRLRALQPRQRDDRPRLQHGLGRTCRAARSRARPTWARRATPTPTAPPSPRTRSAARGRRSTSSTASSRPTAP